MENEDNIRPQLEADMDHTETTNLISRQAYANLATVTRNQLLSDIGNGASGGRQMPFMRWAAHEDRRRKKNK